MLPEPTEEELRYTVLECLECGSHDQLGRRWKAFVTTDQTLLVYCAGCAEREFGD